VKWIVRSATSASRTGTLAPRTVAPSQVCGWGGRRLAVLALAAVDPMLDGKQELVLDLAELSFLDSTGLRAFLIVAEVVGHTIRIEE